jgi:microcystin degradation protein MlrC
MLRGEVNPILAWRNRPMLPHVMCQSTNDFPNKRLQDMTRRMEAEGALTATLLVGFPHADIHNAGLSAVVVTDNDLDLAERYRNELLDFSWSNREAMVYQIEPPELSLTRARKVTKGPVVLLDHYDNAASGAPWILWRC